MSLCMYEALRLYVCSIYVCEFIHEGEYLCACMHVCVCIYTCMHLCMSAYLHVFLCICVCLSAATSALPIHSPSPRDEINQKSKRTAVSDTSQATSGVRCQAANTQQLSLPRSFTRLLLLPSADPPHTAAKTIDGGSFRWRCLPPTRAMLTFERNSEH